MTDSKAVFPTPGSTTELESGASLTPRFGSDGVVAAVATDAESGEVLMLAWMNPEALALTIRTAEAHFYSRSRKRLWKKGEESGNVLEVVELRTDCDQDAVWMRVRMKGLGAACHTGHRTCFYRRIPLGPEAAAAATALQHAGTPIAFDPAKVYGDKG
ncbi:MAG: phosphoribosyl-AMP cyclohydrolase [Hyphomicrobiaceae bacterium]|nr:phosphoribosyl-AMP cyclohydrolase [Hyphomicrobiaceae bacterium]